MSAVQWCAPGSASSSASRFWSFDLVHFVTVGPSFSSCDLCEVAHDPEKVRCVGPCACSAGLFASPSSFRIHRACFMVCFTSSLSSILPSSSTFTPACFRLAPVLCASSRSGSCCSCFPIASACSCTAFRVHSHELKRAASAMTSEGARRLHPPSMVLRQCCAPPPVLPPCPSG